MSSVSNGRLNYINENYSYYFGRIYEYDIHNAYPSLLVDKDYVYLDSKLKTDIYNLVHHNKKIEKKDLLIRIGKEMAVNKEISVYLHDSLKDIIESFKNDNELNESNIISIKKDALFTIKSCKKLDYERIRFRSKNEYNLYFYDYISKQEYYIYKHGNSIKFSIKGLGKNVDQQLYTMICNLIYNTLSNKCLKQIQTIQNMFLKDPKIEQLYPYIPSTLLYNEFVYIPKDMFFENENLSHNDLKNIYFKYYHNIFKTLINYLI